MYVMRFGHVCLFVATGLFTINSVNGFFSYIYSFKEGIRSFACKYIECCNKDWTETDFNALAWTLTQNVYGQQIANEIVVSALKGHLRQSSPRSKALTLSFHGRPGVGKNYVATFIQNSLFDKGYKSRYAHFFSGRLHFPLESEVDIYKLNLIRWIQGNVSQCEYSVFVFDEVDKIPPKVLDAVKPFIDYHEEIYGVDFRKSIFIFLSNTGGDAIAAKYMQLWESGKKREELKLRDFEDMIRIGAFNEKGGFYKSETIESSLIDHYIPFLPLEERHVRLCIHNEFNKRGYHPKENEVKEIMDDLGFGPPHQPILSNAGCKRIAQKVVAHIENKIHWEL